MSALELRGRLLVDGALRPGQVTVEDGRVAGVRHDVRPSVEERARVLAPGLVDLHVHGFGGADPLEDLAGMATALARAGTTAFQPTLFPAHPGVLGNACAELWRRVEAHEAAAASGIGGVDARGARVLGLHLEGPFVNPRAAGALPRDQLVQPSLDALSRILGPATGDGRGVRTMTLAPELPGASDLVRELVHSGVRVSLGHSLATAPEAHLAVHGGASGVTHLYNAMRGFHHREAGLAGVALTDELLFAEIIGDQQHVGPEAFELALRARGALGLCLVSDALAGAGTGCERFHHGGREHLAHDGAFFHAGAGEGAAPTLAGSASSQLEMVRKLVARGVVSLDDALTMATAAPARALGLAGELGELAVGARADLIQLHGETLALEGVWIAGVRVVGEDAPSGAGRADDPQDG